MRAAARRSVRWLLGGRGPLKRGTDRVEAVSRLVVLVLMLAAIPIALLVAGGVRSHLDGVAAAEAAARHPVAAHLLQDAAAPVTTDPNADPNAPVPARVQWTTSSGEKRSGTVPVPPSARAGTPVRVWLAADGRLTTPPRDPRTISDDVACAGILSAVLVPLLALGAHRLLLLVLDRRRSRQWASDWQTVEPVWTARRG